MNAEKTQVLIIGGGPSGLLLSALLAKSGIESIVLEQRTRNYVLSRIRAGILEQGFVGLLREVGLADRMQREGFRHKGIAISYADCFFSIDFEKLIGSHVMVYGQTEVTRDLYAAHEGWGTGIYFNVTEVEIHAIDTSPSVTFRQGEKSHEIQADFIAGCDGFHGVSRQHIPKAVQNIFEKTYPFGWLGILSETPPVHEELIYACSPQGFALCSMRNQNLSRYYIQVEQSDRVENWSDHAFWDALQTRLPPMIADKLITGPSIEKSIAPLRSFVCAPMSYGRLFLCGDAAHIVPPTGAKGLNTAGSDVYYLWHALMDYYRGDEEALIDYSDKALSRVWKAARFSWWMTHLLHRFPNQSAFDDQIQQAELAYLQSSPAAQAALAENYVGLPY